MFLGSVIGATQKSAVNVDFLGLLSFAYPAHILEDDVAPLRLECDLTLLVDHEDDAVLVCTAELDGIILLLAVAQFFSHSGAHFVCGNAEGNILLELLEGKYEGLVEATLMEQGARCIGEFFDDELTDGHEPSFFL